MRKQTWMFLMAVGLLGIALAGQAYAQATSGQAVPCAGYNAGKNVSLACEIPTLTRSAAASSAKFTLGGLTSTMAAQLVQLPIATAVSGSGLEFDSSLGVWRSVDSIGTILTQRGETLGRHKYFLSFTYQRFGFGSIDGVRLRDLPVINQSTLVSGGQQLVSTTQETTRIDLRVDQFAAVGAFGLTNKLDVAVVIPFSEVHLASQVVSGAQYIYTPSTQTSSVGPMDRLYFPGSATGLGDLTFNVKYAAYGGEKTKIAIGGEFRAPTGDESNLLGSGAYGFRPYIIVSRNSKLGRKISFTPNLNVGYQWNGASALYVNETTGAHRNLPSSLFYSGGADIRVSRRISLVAEFVGQVVFSAPRLALSTANVQVPVTLDGKTQTTAMQTVVPYQGTYAMNNLGGGFKLNPYKGLIISASALFKLDDAGLRSKIIPLVGVSYRF